MCVHNRLSMTALNMIDVIVGPRIGMGLCVSTSTLALCKQGMTYTVVGNEWVGAVVYT